MTDKRIFHFFANNRNLGDRYSAYAIREILELAGQSSQINQSYIPVQIESKKFSLDKNRIERIVNQITSRDLVVLGGGALLHPFFSEFWSIVFKNKKIEMINLIGIGAVENATSTASEFVNQFKCNQNRFSSVICRDNLTSDFFTSCNISTIQTFCPSMFYIKSQLDEIEEISSSSNRHLQILFARHKEIESMGLLGNGGLVDFGGLEKFYNADYKISRTSNILKIGTKIEASSVIRKYMKSDLVVSSRLHGAIIAFVAQKPIVTFNYDRKICDFIEAIFSNDVSKGIITTGELIKVSDIEAIKSTIERIMTPIGEFEMKRRYSVIESLRFFYENHALNLLKDSL